MIKTDLSNYYGTVEFTVLNGTPMMLLENWDGEYAVEIPEDMYDIASVWFSENEIFALKLVETKGHLRDTDKYKNARVYVKETGVSYLYNGDSWEEI